MTVRDVVGALARRFYVVIAVALAFAALTQAAARDGGSFYTNTTVTFSLPMRSTLLPGSGTTDSSVIAFAGAVATEINDGRPVFSYSTSDAPSYGAGMREGVAVGLRNDGNQWMAIFPSATIDIRIVGRTQQWVEEQQSTVLAKVIAVAEGQQNASATVPADQITARVGPLSTEIFEASASRTSQMMAISAMALAALIVGIPCAVIVDRMIRRTHTRSRRSRIERRRAPAHAGSLQE